MTRDPRESYKDNEMPAATDPEAALYADFTDTDDEDIYFGGGNDEDGDYDDEGNELRPRGRGRRASRADSDPSFAEESETDSEEDEREFNEVFGQRGRNRQPAGRNQRGRRFDRGDDTDEETEDKKFRNLQRKGSPLFVDPNAAAKITRPGRGKQQGRSEAKKVDFREPDPEIGIHPDTFKKRFEKRSDEKLSTADRGFSADEFLTEKEISSEEDRDSDWDEERMIREGEEEMEELADVSAMMRDYDRPRSGKQSMPMTAELIEEEAQRQIQEDDFYESDDVEVPHAEDPRRQKEIADEHEENMRKLRSTSGGRKMLKSLNREHEWINDFPPRGKQHYENALRDTPLKGPPPPAPESPPREKRRSEKPAERVHVVPRHDPMSSAAPSKAEDSWRRMSSEFDVEAQDGDFLSDLRQ